MRGEKEADEKETYLRVGGGARISRWRGRGVKEGGAGREFMLVIHMYGGVPQRRESPTL
jgi:hypothetical protein